MAARLAQSGDWVLLSPMCASFDMFRDFEERGDAFKHSVRALVSLERQPHARATHPPDGYPATGWVPRHRRGTRPHRAGRAPAAPR